MTKKTKSRVEGKLEKYKNKKTRFLRSSGGVIIVCSRPLSSSSARTRPRCIACCVNSTRGARKKEPTTPVPPKPIC